jgi:hypothetical protein
MKSWKAETETASLDRELRKGEVSRETAFFRDQPLQNRPKQIMRSLLGVNPFHGRRTSDQERMAMYRTVMPRRVMYRELNMGYKPVMRE